MILYQNRAFSIFFLKFLQPNILMLHYQSHKYDLGMIIGKCENILTLTFILADQFTGLALIFAANY